MRNDTKERVWHMSKVCYTRFFLHFRLRFPPRDAIVPIVLNAIFAGIHFKLQMLKISLLILSGYGA